MSQNTKSLGIYTLHLNGSLFGNRNIDGVLVSDVLANVDDKGSLRLNSDLQEKLAREYGPEVSKCTDKRLRVTDISYAPVGEKAPLFKDILYVPFRKYVALGRPQTL